MKFRKRQKSALIALCALTLLLIGINIAVIAFFEPLNALVCGTFSTATAAETEEALEEGTALAEEIEGEGLVLARNEDGTLPLSKDETDRVNVFGWSSTQWIGSGSGSGRCVSVKTDLLAALESYGISYNGALTDMYEDFQGDRPYYNNTQGSLNSHSWEFSRLYEPSVGDADYYAAALLEGAEAYSDTAIVVLGRVSGESNDCPKTQYKRTEKNGVIVTDEERTYLEISSEEEELLTYVGGAFEKVIVIVNSTNAMELGFLETIEGLDACVIAGGTGESGANAVVRAIFGEISPSGKTADTYAYELESAATYANAGAEGEGTYTNSEGLYPYGEKNVNVGTSEYYDGVYYVDYAESVYVGYRWYETADEEGYWDGVSNEYGSGYEGVVQYPFGYGLSYTEFGWDLLDVSPSDGSALSADGEISVSVRVTNTGDAPGKDVVELYFSAPYFEGEIEKASRELCAFAKTEELGPGESCEVTLSFSVYDMASYDCYDLNANGFAGYELDATEDRQAYGVYVMQDAHRQAFDGPAAEYLLDSDILYPEDPDTGETVENRFTGTDAEDGVSLDGSDSAANIEWLSRADFEGTFPSTVAEDRAMSENVMQYNAYTEEMAESWIDAGDTDIVTDADNGIVVYVEEEGITEDGLTLGADYDDPLWEELLNQLSLKEMEGLVSHYYLSPNDAISSIGKYATFEADGPGQIGSFNAVRQGTGFPMPTVIAQTWNSELAAAFGSQVGLEAADLGYDGWYAPGINLHRSPFGGRNYEYYSEDGFLTGSMCSEVVNGCLDRGVYCYVKHFAAYDQDSNRDGLYVWMSEQALREIYLKPFEIAVKSGATGLMSAYNRLGAVWVGGSSALNTGVLRGEWQFCGATLTDYCDNPDYVSSDQFLRAGGDQVLYAFGGDVSFRYETESNSYRQAVRRAAKDSIYIWLNALYRNSVSDMPARALRTGGGWLAPVLIVADVAAFAGLAIWCFLLLRKGRRQAKSRAES